MVFSAAVVEPDHSHLTLTNQEFLGPKGAPTEVELWRSNRVVHGGNSLFCCCCYAVPATRGKYCRKFKFCTRVLLFN